MTTLRTLAVLSLMLLGLNLQAQVQTFQPKGMGSVVQLRAEPSADGSQGMLFAPPPGMVSAIGAGGEAGGGLGLSGIGNLQIGFSYIRPYWTFRDFTLAVPAGNAGNFPILGDTGHVDSIFALSPRIDYNYYFTNLEFGIKASGNMLNLNGNLHQDITSPLGTGKLDATSSLTIIVANLVEFRKHFEASDWRGTWCDCSLTEDLLVDAGIGTRYSSIVQNYAGTLTNTTVGAVNNATTRNSNQSFNGLGLTMSLNLAKEVAKGFFMFAENRVSILVGDNHRNSSLAVQLANVQTIDSITENKTIYLPVGETDFGLQWQTPIKKTTVTTGATGMFILRTALTCQYWADVGPLSAGSPQAFQQSDLILFGVNVMAGFSY